MTAAPDSPIIEATFPVRYAETDAMGVVHHANYLVYFEEARSHFMRQLGKDYAEFEQEGFQLPVTEVSIRYAGSLRYGERVRVQAWVQESRSRRLTFAYQVVRADSNEKLVSGYTRHIWTDGAGKVTRAPAAWLALMKEIA